MAQSERDVLVERLGRYPVQRYPVQHATTQFHLGSVLLHAGDTIPALQALTAAGEVFERSGMRLEQAKATVLLGVALRTAGRLEEATAALTRAGAELGALGQRAEQAAAAYDLGLVHQDSGDPEAAAAAWSQARELFLEAGFPAQAAASARDHGASLLAMGKSSDALPLLERALALAEQAGDEPGTGAAANALGLAQLAEGDTDGATAALRRALAAYPRSVRPADHAMAKANLALAYDQAGDGARARLAAGQALAIHSAAAPVRAQAQQLLGRRSGRASEDLIEVLDTEPRDQWVAVLREEMLRAVDLSTAHRCAVVSGFLDGAVARPGASYDLVESLLQVVIELPPRTYELLVSAIVTACADSVRDPDRVRAVIGSTMARFALPQWQRLAASLNAAARQTGQPATWR